MTAVLLPVKSLHRAKSRLSDLLNGVDRSRLAWAMFKDVARAVSGSRLATEIVVVTSDGRVGEAGGHLGWEVFLEREQRSESRSVDWASRKLAEDGFDSILRLPADIPLLQSSDIDDLLGRAPHGSGSVLVPSHDGTGTNALLRSPPNCFPARFGDDSYRRHTSEAYGLGIEVVVVRNPRIELDLDTPEDLWKFLERPTHGSTLSLLKELRLGTHP